MMTTVNCSFIQLDPERFPSRYTIDNEIAIFYADLHKFVPFVSNYKKLLNNQELEKSLAFHRKQDQLSFIVRRGMLRFLLGNLLDCPPESIEFKLGENKRPEIRYPKNTTFTFSSSHSSGRIAIAIGKDLLGIDIEHINPQFEYEDIARQFFSKSEYEFILTSPDPIKTFFVLWTRKEALLKANSFGIDDKLILVPSLDGEQSSSHSGITKSGNWVVKSFNPKPDYIISIASSVETTIALFELNREAFDL